MFCLHKAFSYSLRYLLLLTLLVQIPVISVSASDKLPLPYRVKRAVAGVNQYWKQSKASKYWDRAKECLDCRKNRPGRQNDVSNPEEPDEEKGVVRQPLISGERKRPERDSRIEIRIEGSTGGLPSRMGNEGVSRTQGAEQNSKIENKEELLVSRDEAKLAPSLLLQAVVNLDKDLVREVLTVHNWNPNESRGYYSGGSSDSFNYYERAKLRVPVLSLASAINGAAEIVQLLLEHKADVNATGLYKVKRYERNFGLSRGSDEGNDNTTALHWAAAFGDSDTVEKLISAKADVNPANKAWSLDSPLLSAIRLNELNVVHLLLNAKADPSRVPSAFSAFDEALERDQRDGGNYFAQALNIQGAVLKKKPTFLQLDWYGNDIERPESWFGIYGDDCRVDESPCRYSNCYHLRFMKALENHNILLAAAILREHHMDVNFRWDGKTPLEYLLYPYKESFLLPSLEYGGTSKKHQTSIEPIAAFLIKSKADVNSNSKSESNGSPLYGAIKAGQTKLARLLIEEKADVKAALAEASTGSLESAVRVGRVPMVDLLMDVFLGGENKEPNCGFQHETLSSIVMEFPSLLWNSRLLNRLALCEIYGDSRWHSGESVLTIGFVPAWKLKRFDETTRNVSNYIRPRCIREVQPFIPATDLAALVVDYILGPIVRPKDQALSNSGASETEDSNSSLTNITIHTGAERDDRSSTHDPESPRDDVSEPEEAQEDPEQEDLAELEDYADVI